MIYRDDKAIYVVLAIVYMTYISAYICTVHLVKSGTVTAYYYSTALTQHHLTYLLEDTFDARNKWLFIGLQLGLTDTMLSTIQSNNPSSEELQYTKMLSQWIEGGSATVEKLINAFEANTVQLKGMANKLRKKYAKIAQGMDRDIVIVRFLQC